MSFHFYMETIAKIQFYVKLGMMQMNVKMTAAHMNYKVSKKLIFKWHEHFEEGWENVKDDSRIGRLVNMRWHNLAESLMDACINKGAVQRQGAQRTSDVFRQLLLTST